jgi:integrase
LKFPALRTKHSWSPSPSIFDPPNPDFDAYQKTIAEAVKVGCHEAFLRFLLSRIAEEHSSHPLSNATLNRDLALLRRSYTLARKDFPGFKARIEFEMLAESAPRAGFFDAGQLEAVRRHLPPYLQPLATFGFETGWRRAEVLGLTWARVSFTDGEVRLDPGSTKNGEGRSFPFTDTLRALLEAQRAATDALQRKTGRIIPLVFHHNGRPIRDYRKAWATACGKAGCPGRIFHDLRRSAVRRFEHAGIARSVAMKLTGHKTENGYRRYAIVSDRELRQAAATLSRRVDGHNSGHNGVPIQRTVEK